MKTPSRSDRHAKKRPPAVPAPDTRVAPKEFEAILGYSFRNPALLVQALTHPSYSDVHKGVPNNQRLEFLGDAIVGMLTAEYAFLSVPDVDEGLLTVMRTQCVSGRALAAISEEMNLGAFLFVEGGANRDELRRQRRNLAAGFEAVLGAVWIDGGAEGVRKVFQRFIVPRFESVSRDVWAGDPKGKLQSIAQKLRVPLPAYAISAEGPDHARYYHVTVSVRNVEAPGEGPSRRDAEAAAARAWLDANAGDERLDEIFLHYLATQAKAHADAPGNAPPTPPSPAKAPEQVAAPLPSSPPSTPLPDGVRGQAPHPLPPPPKPAPASLLPPAESLALVERLLAEQPQGTLHAIGVTGIGLSGVAALFAARGWKTDGCDATPNPELVKWLADRGVSVSKGHSVGHIYRARPCLVVRSPAVADDNPEVQRALRLGIPVVPRGAALAALVNASRTVAVCGTHGKTTTSCFIVQLLRALGDAPSWCIGGRTAEMGAVANAGAPGAPFVVEADESDGTLSLYRPAVAVVSSVEADHLEHFGSLEALHDCFRAALRATRERVVFCQEAPGAAAVAADIPGAFGYGFGEEAALRATGVALAPTFSAFDVAYLGRPLGRVKIDVPGRHNVLNALGALAAAIALGHAPDEAFQAVASLDQLPARRFERSKTGDGVFLVSDYSHHPTEIAALVATARMQKRKHLLAVFQPHRYSRTKALLDRFPDAFRGIDQLLLLPVYAASEAPVEGGRTEDLYRAFRERIAAGGPSPSGDDAPIPLPALADSVEAGLRWIVHNMKQGDVVLVIGAGDVVSILDPLRAARLEHLGQGAPKRARFNAPLAPLTSYGVGGAADVLVEVHDIDELKEALAYADRRELPVRMIGQGTNILASDAGVRGVTIHLKGDLFNRVDIGDDGLVQVGCGVAGALLLARLRKKGFGGLEYMAGIPGSVGGWLAMNAGTRDGAFGDRVLSFYALDAKGEEHQIDAGAAGFSYRECKAIQDGGLFAVAVALRAERLETAEITRRLAEAQAKRFDFSGLRTAGSVFRNPPDTSAGKLLDEAGCKGLRVGGAFVCDRHANIISTEDDATASDVLALVATMRDRVLAKSGVTLQPEIRIW